MCKSSNEEVQKVDLREDKYDEINIQVNDQESIEFDVKKWKPVFGKKTTSVMSNIIEEENDEQSEKEESQDKEEDKTIIDNLQKQIEVKDEKIKDLEQKIQEVNDKIETMHKILSIDVSEQNYVNELTKKVNEEKNG